MGSTYTYTNKYVYRNAGTGMYACMSKKMAPSKTNLKTYFGTKITLTE